MVPLFGSNASAQFFDGWGWFGFSAVHGEIFTLHTPNPQSKPSQMVVMANMTVETACVNPATNGVFAGKAFKATVVGSSPAANGGFVQTTQGNAGKTDLFLDLSAFEEPANARCPNPGWTVLKNSAMALNFSGTVQWCLIDSTTGGPDCTGKGILDSSTVKCALDMTDPENQRNPDGTAPHTAVFGCTEPQ
jgi:hypothetical protein